MEEQVTGWVSYSGRQCRRLREYVLVLGERGLLPQSLLLPPAVIVPLDPCHDPQPQSLPPGVPGPGIEDVVAQQRVERFHSCVVPDLSG